MQSITDNISLCDTGYQCTIPVPTTFFNQSFHQLPAYALPLVSGSYPQTSETAETLPRLPVSLPPRRRYRQSRVQQAVR